MRFKEDYSSSSSFHSSSLKRVLRLCMVIYMLENLPPGFRFHPTDEELITYYLTQKVLDFGFSTHAIADVDLNKCEPWDLPARSRMGGKEWYFFSLRDRKYPTGLRTNRATAAGYWKTTGKDKEIFHCGLLAGMKKTLVFYKGRAPRGEKTSWVMHEYRMQTKFPYKPSKEEWVVCRVFNKSSNGKKPVPNSSSLPSPLSSTCNTAAVTELGELDASTLNNMVNPPGSFSSMQTNEISSSSNINDSRMDINLYMNWMLARESLIGSGLISASPSVLKAASPLNGYPSLDVTNLSSLGSFIGQATDALQQQQQQHEHESMWRGY